MKKFFVFVGLMMALTLSAQQVQIDGVWYSLSDNLTAKVSTKDGFHYKGDVVIPASVTYQGRQYQVTAIMEGAFNNCRALHTVAIPATLTDVEGIAFDGCDSLMSPIYNATIFVKMPKLFGGKYVVAYRTATIAPGAFEGCKFMTAVVLYEGITKIGNRAFNSCPILKQIELPKTCATLGSEALDGRYLEKITIKNPDMQYGANAFTTDWMSATIVIPEGTDEKVFPQGVNFEYTARPQTAPEAPVVVVQTADDDDEEEAKPKLTEKEKQKLAAQKEKDKKKAQAEKAKAQKKKAAAKKKAQNAKKKAAKKKAAERK